MNKKQLEDIKKFDLACRYYAREGLSCKEELGKWGDESDKSLLERIGYCGRQIVQLQKGMLEYFSR